MSQSDPLHKSNGIMMTGISISDVSNGFTRWVSAWWNLGVHSLPIQLHLLHDEPTVGEDAHHHPCFPAICASHGLRKAGMSEVKRGIND